MKIFLFVLVAFSSFCCDVLFYVQDAGETFGLLPVAEALRASGVDVEVLVGGVAEGKGRSVGEYGVVIDPRGPRTQVYDESLALAIIDDLRPILLVSGVAFEWQGQLYEACRKRGVDSIAFWDNFNPDGNNPYFETAKLVQKSAAHLWVPSGRVAEAFVGRENLYVAGQPSLEVWAEEASKINREELRARFNLESKVGVFIGGYGSDYEAALELFLNCLRETPDLSILIQPHPKFGGKIEAEIVARHLNLPVRILQNEMTTIESVVCADVVLCHESTVGFQAQFLGKKVIRFPSEVSMSEGFKAALDNEGSQDDLGIPLNGIERCVQYTKGIIL